MNKTTRIIALALIALATDAKADEQMRIAFADRCPVSDGQKEAFLGVVATNILVNVGTRLIGDTVDAISRFLTTADAKTYSARGRINAFAARDANGVVTINSSEACVVVAVGVFGDGSRKDLFDGVPKELESASLEVARITRLAGSPQFYFEGVLSASRSGDAFTLIPKYWYYPRFLQKTDVAHKKDRDILFKLELAAPGKAAFAAWQLDWASVSEGSIKVADVKDRVLPWSPLPQEISTQTKPGTTYLPVNANAVFTETAQPHTLAKYLGEALAGQKQTIVSDAQAALQSALSEQARLDASKVLLTATDGKLKSYSDAYAAASAAQAKFEAAKATPGRAAALAAAQIAYSRLAIAARELQVTYQSAGLGPFPELPSLPDLPKA